MERIDNLLASFWSIILKPLCFLTGRDNFFFAHFTLLLAAMPLAVAGLLSSPLYWISFVIQAMALVRLRGTYRLLEHFAAQSGATKVWPFTPQQWQRFRLLRIMLTLLGMVFLSSQEQVIQLFGASLLLTATSMYFAADFRPRRPSIVTRAVKRAGRILSRVRLPSPLPQPT
ncbi:hypothetical protein KY386_01250 [Candidatus Parcubacteria bacterium]|nr:hypothetical protein [Candidatus Parcubacteria bacterium]